MSRNFLNNYYWCFLKSLVLIFALVIGFPALSQVKEVEKIQQELITAVNDTSRAKLLNDAAFLLRGNNPKLSLQYANLAMELSVKSTYNRGKLNSYLIKGIIYKRLGDYEKAMVNYTCALQISELLNDKTRISSCYNNIGSIYQTQNNYPKAISYFNKSLEIEKTLNNKEQASIRLYNIGTVYEAMNKLDTALNFYNQSLFIEEELKNNEGISFALYGLGGVLTKKGEYAKAEVYLKKAYDLAYANKDISGMSYCKHELGALYLSWNKTDLAIANFIESTKYSDSLQEKDQINESYRKLATAYAKKENFKEAYLYFLKYDELNEEINNSDISQKITEINTKYEVDKLDKEMELVRKEARIKELELNQQKSMGSFLIFTSILVIIIGFFRFNKRKSLTNNLLNDNSEQKIKHKFSLEKMLFSKKAWALMLGIYIFIYSAFVQPFGLAIFDWIEKLQVVAVYAGISVVALFISYAINSRFGNYYRSRSHLLKYTIIALVTTLIITVLIFLYNGMLELNDFSFFALIIVFYQIIVISLLPVLVMILFAERINYSENLKDIPLEAIGQPASENNLIDITDNMRQLVIQTDNVSDIVRISPAEIICFEANDNYTAIFFLKEKTVKKELYRITLKKTEAQLFEFKEFIRCHKSYIINISFLERISGNAQGFKMHLSHIDFDIPVSRSFPRQIIDSLKENTSRK